MALATIPLTHFGSANKMLKDDFNLYAQEHLAQDRHGNPFILLKVWDYENPISDQDLTLSLTGGTLTKVRDFTNHISPKVASDLNLPKSEQSYAERWYIISPSDTAGHVVLTGTDTCESCFISWSALGDTKQRHFQDREGNGVAWCADNGFHEPQVETEQLKATLLRRLRAEDESLGLPQAMITSTLRAKLDKAYPPRQAQHDLSASDSREASLDLLSQLILRLKYID